MQNSYTAAPEILGPNAESIVTFWMEKYHLGELDRDGAIGSLVMLANGKGQPVYELFTKFPEFGKTYFDALLKSREAEPVAPTV